MKYTAISVSVSDDTQKRIKTLLEDSKFVSKIQKDGIFIKDQSQFFRLAIAVLLSSDVDTIKKHIVFSVSDAVLLSLLKRHTEAKNAS